MKVLLWIYAITGSGYFFMHQSGADFIARYAVGPLWLLMMLAPMVLSILIVVSIIRGLGGWVK